MPPPVFDLSSGLSSAIFLKPTFLLDYAIAKRKEKRTHRADRSIAAG